MKVLDFIGWVDRAIERVLIGIKNLLTLLFCLGIAVAVIYGVYDALTIELPRWSAAWCEHRWQQSGLDVQWKIGVGCIVYVNGRWVPQANVQLSPNNSN
jgi:hypothetical protein